MAMAAALALAAPPAGAEHARFLPIGDPIDPPAGFRDLCDRLDWACALPAKAEAAAGEAEILSLAARVNRAVNAGVPQVSDLQQYGVREFWDLPTARGGDCEDVALLKKKLLISQGVPAARLLISTVLDRQRRSHAVLVLRSALGDLVLDTIRGRILEWDRTGYSFLRIQNPEAPRQWNAVLSGGIFDRDAG
ncbi:MAG: hypothetical protein Kow0045_19570 [Albidovulum sp.]